MARPKTRERLRLVRKVRIRRKVAGTAERPRLCVYRSNKHIYAQLVDDTVGKTLGTVSTLSKEFKSTSAKPGTVAAAKTVGTLVAGKAKALQIQQVVFDRGGYRYHGAVKALAEAVREGGLAF